MEPNILDTIENEVKQLKAQKLRSNTVILTRIYPLIVEAQRLGYTHEAINERTSRGGLGLNLGTYHNALHRVKKGIESGSIVPTKELLISLSSQIATYESQAPSKILEAMTENKTHVVAESQESVLSISTAANQIQDTLKESVKVGSRDYSKVAMQKLKSKGNQK